MIASLSDFGKKCVIFILHFGLASYLEKINDHCYNGAPSDLAIFFFLPLSVVHGVWYGFGCIVSNMYLCRSLRIWWPVYTNSDDVIYFHICSFRQVKIYWFLRGHKFLSCIHTPKSTLSKVQLDRQDLPKESIKSWCLCKSELYLILSLRRGP